MAWLKEIRDLVVRGSEKTPAWRRAGQVVLEYAVLVAVVAAAFLTMALYVKRAVQGQVTDMEGLVTAKRNVTASTIYAGPPI